MDKKWRCLVTGEAIDISECQDCHTRSCAVNVGFAEGPEKVEEPAEETTDKKS